MSELALPTMPEPEVSADRETLRTAARNYLAKHPEPVITIQGETPVAFREALFDAMAEEGVPIVKPLADRLRSLVWQEHCTGAGNRCDRTDLQFQQKLAQSILWGVHDLVEYKPDPVRGMQDFVSRVGETLRSRRKTPRSELTGYLRGQGDCEDMSILFVALARALGFRANTMWIQQDGAFQNHVAATVYIPTVIAPSRAPMWAETTIDGARLGEHPWVVVERLGHTPRVFGGQP